ncbi:MAG: nucleotidyl transferase AbiEii/AbiGii toxin family protein [Candidatus Omnitrophica bacterium]|nr:nucleotidyl transferase AbiEii/AbiGii toxin family protein [Candidatus Omnitrophota bacterium]
MWDLSKHERLEIEILNGLNSKKISDHLVFCGGTMLRLCHELNRYSVDLDFWFVDISKEEEIYKEINKYLEENYKLKTAANKHSSLIFEFGSKDYIRNLKIEVRKAERNIKYEEKIAFSRHSDIQVMVKAATLEEMMRAKVETFLNRVRIRDIFDIEFLLRRGIKIEALKAQLKEMEKLIRRFRAKDYKITLGSLLEFKDRQYYKTANFRYLLSHIKTELAAGSVQKPEIV